MGKSCDIALRWIWHVSTCNHILATRKDIFETPKWYVLSMRKRNSSLYRIHLWTEFEQTIAGSHYARIFQENLSHNTTTRPDLMFMKLILIRLIHKFPMRSHLLLETDFVDKSDIIIWFHLASHVDILINEHSDTLSTCWKNLYNQPNGWTPDRFASMF